MIHTTVRCLQVFVNTGPVMSSLATANMQYKQSARWSSRLLSSDENNADTISSAVQCLDAYGLYFLYFGEKSCVLVALFTAGLF